MTRYRSLAAMVLVLLPLGLLGCRREHSAAPDAFDRLIELARVEIERQGVPGAAVAVLIDGEAIRAAGVGSKRAGAVDPVHADTLFGVGSTTKMLVAAALLSLRDQGKLDLDKPVTRYVPGFRLGDPFAERTGEITLRHLLSHTAGLPDLSSAVCDQSLESHFEREHPPLWADPGTVYDYSNLGYDLAGLALEKVDGRPFEAAMRARVFEPAGMGAATFDPRAAMQLDHSLGHRREGDQPVPVELDSSDCRWTMPSGTGTYATAADMVRFARELLADGGDMLSALSVWMLETPQVVTHELPGATYAFGLEQLKADSPRVLYHNGNDQRFSSFVALAPERRFAVAVLMNSQEGDPDPIVQKALELYLGTAEGLPLTHLERGEWSVPVLSLPRYEGTYAEPLELGRVVVTVEAEHLLAEFPETGTSARLFPLAGDTFLAVSDALPESLSLSFLFDERPEHASRIVTRAGIFTRSE